MRFLSAVLDSVRVRFSHDKDFLEHCSVFIPGDRRHNRRLFNTTMLTFIKHLGTRHWTLHDAGTVTTQLNDWLYSETHETAGDVDMPICKYWCAMSEVPKYANLAKFVLTVLAILPTSVICEQIFSHFNRIMGLDKTHMRRGLADAKVRIARSRKGNDEEKLL